MKCEICGKEYKQGFWLHVTKAHNITKEEYQSKFSRENNVNEIKEEKVSEENALDVILNKYGITLEQLIDALDKFAENKIEKESAQNESDVILSELDKSEKEGYLRAKELNGPDNLSVNNVFVADALVKHFNYKVTTVSSAPKIWYLEKKEE